MSSLPSSVLPTMAISASFEILLTLFSPGGKFSPGKYAAASAQQSSQPGSQPNSQQNSPPVFELFEHAGADRVAVEQFISQRFHESFASRVEVFMPRLFSLRQQNGELCAAFGLRSASRKLFLEHYLDTPIEQTISARTGHSIERRSIVEVGHFSGTFPGAVRAMVALLAAQLQREGVEWVVFTGTTALRNALARLGLSTIDIQAASAERLPEEQRAAWGNYYRHAPRVLVGKVSEGYRALYAADTRRPGGSGTAA